MEIALLIVASLAFLLSLLTLLLLLKKNKGNSFTSQDSQKLLSSLEDMKTKETTDIALLNNRLDQISSNVQKQLSEELSKNTIQELQNRNEQQQKNNEIMNSLSASVNKTLQDNIALLRSSIQETSDKETKRLSDFQAHLNQQFLSLSDSLNSRIDNQMKTIHQKVDTSLQEGFKGTSESMAKLQSELSVLQEAQKNIEGLKGEISSLSSILTNNQKRGKYGEWQLEMLLQNMFGDTKGILYDTQYTLNPEVSEEKRLRPDAVVFLDGKDHHQIIAIDSKFSLSGGEELFTPDSSLSPEEEEHAKSSFKSALRQRIQETSKYVLPGTTIGEAIMFIPDDGIFAYIEKEFPDLVSFAQKNKVVLACPTILDPLLASFRLFQINHERMKNVDKISKAIDDLSKDFKNFLPRWEDLNKRIQSLTDSSNKFSITVNKINNRFSDISHSEIENPDENNSLPD
ncbi:MAG: DNA recombination protein RmuC [Eubacteriales bacterium]|nr:DNA recombination protein RmuC [Eubacteriales bacterium]